MARKIKLTEHGLPLDFSKGQPSNSNLVEKPVTFKMLVDWARLRPLPKCGRKRGQRLSKKEAAERLKKLVMAVSR